MHRRAVKTLREALPLLALVMLQHRLGEPLARRRPAADPFDRQPRVRSIEGLLVGRQRVEPAHQPLGQLPEPDVDQTAGHPQLDLPRPLVADAGAGGDRQHGDPRLVKREVVDAAGGRGRVVGHPEEVAARRQRRDAAVAQLLELRPRERVAGAHQLANAGEEQLELGEQGLGAFGRRLDGGGLGLEVVDAGHGRRGAWRLDGARRRDGTRRGLHGARRRGSAGRRRRRLRGNGLRRRLRGLLPGHTAHEIAHADHQETPTMSLMTSAMIFSPTSLTRFE